jgi:hypothetical protein
MPKSPKTSTASPSPTEILIINQSNNVIYASDPTEVPTLLHITFGDYIRVYDTEYKVLSRTWSLGTPILEITVQPTK